MKYSNNKYLAVYLHLRHKNPISQEKETYMDKKRRASLYKVSVIQPNNFVHKLSFFHNHHPRFSPTCHYHYYCYYRKHENIKKYYGQCVLGNEVHGFHFVCRYGLLCSPVYPLGFWGLFFPCSSEREMMISTTKQEKGMQYEMHTSKREWSAVQRDPSSFLAATK